MPVTGGIRPSPEGASALRRMYTAEFKTSPNEEAVVTSHFGSPDGVEKIGDLLNIRVIPTMNTSTLGDTAQGTGIDYNVQTIQNVTADTTFAYAALEIPRHLVTKMTRADMASMRKGQRSQAMKALATKRDSDATAFIAANCSIQQGMPNHFDRPTLLTAIATVVERAREFVDIYGSGGPKVFLAYHPREIPYLLQIPEITAAYARGDKQNPNKTGVILDAYGLEFAETGLVYTANNVAYNPAFTDQAYVQGYNQEADMLPEQSYELVTRYIAIQEYGFVEVFDECTLVVRTPLN